MKTGTYSYSPDKVDNGSTALTVTLQTMNQFKLERVAWNDEKPDGNTSSSSAHSKGIIAYNYTANKGFLIVHSIPKYPAFDNHVVNNTIADSENYYGQHIMCISLSLDQLEKVAYNLLITRPNVYETMVKSSSKNVYINELAQKRWHSTTNLFTTYLMRPQNIASIRSIYKNDLINGSIFEDGLTDLLKKNLVVESWGRPLEEAWCTDQYEVKNVQKVKIGEIEWN